MTQHLGKEYGRDSEGAREPSAKQVPRRGGGARTLCVRPRLSGGHAGRPVVGRARVSSHKNEMRRPIVADLVESLTHMLVI